MFKTLLTFVLSFYLLPLSFAQNIPDNRKVNWEIAGYEGDIPCISILRNAVTEFSIDNTGSTDVSEAINTALQNMNDGEVLYFPNGTYLLEETVNVPSHRVIRGESTDKTIFHIDFSGTGTGIKAQGAGASSTTSVTAIGDFGDFDITVANASGFSVGDEIDFYQENDPAIHGAEDAGDLKSWASDLKGQLAVISAINGNTITLDRSLAFDYDINFDITFRKLSLVEEVGLENFKVVRLSDNGTGVGNNNIHFSYAKNCWSRKIHSEYSSRYHIQIDYSRNLEFNEIYLDKAYSCGGGGAGYGLLMQDRVSECLVENSIAKALRHPWIIKEGCVRNVYAYNFSSGTTQGNDCNADPITESYADISLHGHYPAYNLFEGNIVYRITSSDAWGPNGPGNTFLRNRVLGVKGIWIQSYSSSQNVIGNELTNENAQFEMDRDNTVTGTTLNYSNYGVDGLLDSEAPSTVETSLYTDSKPSYFGTMPWPSIGPGVTFNTGEIPAQVRFNGGKYFSEGSLCAGCQQPNLGTDQSLCGNTSITLDAKISTPSGFTFKWFLEDALVAETSSLEISSAGTYRIETDSAGCLGEDEVDITDVLPTLELGEPIELCDPTEAILSSNIIDPTYTYEWAKDSEVILNANSSSLEVSQPGNYQLTVSAQGCTDESDNVTVTSKLLEADDVVICEKGEVTLTVNSSGEYNWYDKNETFITKASTLVTNVTESTQYYVEDASGFSGLVGMAAPDIEGETARGDDRFDRKMVFDVLQKVKIDSVSVWSKGATQVTVRILASNNSTVLFEKTITGVATSGETRIGLGKVLEAGTYYIDFEGTNGDLYYSYEDDTSIKYPYTLNGLISITGSNPTWINDKPYYMYAYNLRVSAGNSCAKTPINVTINPLGENCAITTSIDSPVEELGLFPNPTTGAVYLPKEQFFKVYSLTGQLLQEGKSSYISLENYPLGVYLFHLEDKIVKVIKH